MTAAITAQRSLALDTRSEPSGPSIEDVLKMTRLVDKAPKGPFYRFCDNLLQDLAYDVRITRYGTKKEKNDFLYQKMGPNKELVSIFAALESEDEDVVSNAEEILRFLLISRFDQQDIMLASFPLWPIDGCALQKIALEQSESKHPTLRQRASFACYYLTVHYFRIGFETAAVLASKKLRDPDEKIKQEGLAYFQMLLRRFNPDLSSEDLVIAIDVASKMLASKEDPSIEAGTFFRKLIEYGKEDDVLKIKEVLLDACASGNYFAFSLCDKIVMRHSSIHDLIAIPLEAAIKGCSSKINGVRMPVSF